MLGTKYQISIKNHEFDDNIKKQLDDDTSFGCYKTLHAYYLCVDN